MEIKVRELPLDRIRCRPQVREAFDEDALDGLARSMEAVGLAQPIVVRPDGDGFVVVDGERRLRAAKKLNWTTIVAIVDDRELLEAQVLQLQLVCNVQRDDLRPCERASAIDRLIRESGWDMSRTAKELGLSGASISKSLALLALPPEAKALVDNGALSASSGYEIAKVRDAKERARLLALAANGHLTRAAVIHALRGNEKGRKRRRTPMAKPETFLIGLDAGISVMVLGPELAVRTVVDAVRAAHARLGALPSVDISVKDAVRLLGSGPSSDAMEAA